MIRGLPIHDWIIRAGHLVDARQVRLRRPERVHDLPSGARLLIPRSQADEAPPDSGQKAMHRGEPTDTRPGGLLRGPRLDATA